MNVSRYPFLEHGGSASREILQVDWASSSLGAIEGWPSVLKSMLGLMLRSAFPKALIWGPELITFHNDAFRAILGGKPPAIGKPFSEVWEEAWDDIGPIAREAFAGRATFIENFPLTISRNGEEEEAYFTFCYSPVVDEEGRIVGMMDTVVETTKAVQAQQRAEVLNGELAHRMRNMLSLVGSIISQTIRSNDDEGSAQLEASLSQRLRALAGVQDVLRTGHMAEAEIHGIVATALAPHSLEEGRVVAEGPNLRLPEEKALALSLALNELLTNAIKYGALSNDDGTVRISWEATDLLRCEGFRLSWREIGGPRVTPPLKAGFGSRLIQRHVAAAFGGTAHITFDPDGVSYEIRTDVKEA